MAQQFITGERIVRVLVTLPGALRTLRRSYGILDRLIAVCGGLCGGKVGRQASICIVHGEDGHVDQCPEGRTMIPTSLLRLLVGIAGKGKIGAYLQFVADVPVNIRPEIDPLLACIYHDTVLALVCPTESITDGLGPAGEGKIVPYKRRIPLQGILPVRILFTSDHRSAAQLLSFPLNP